jgi:predicted  nucleic acid-binding Zn-ribbon protein
MPGKSGAVAVPASRPTPSVPIAVDPVPARPAVSRRAPSNGRLDPESSLAGAMSAMAGMNEGDRYEEPQSDFQRLKSENKELRKLLSEMKQLLQEASETEQKLVAKEKEFEAAQAAKDAQIEELSTHLGAIEEQIAKGELIPPPPVPKTRGELEEWGDELEKENAKLQQERKRLDAERQQLREDEEALESQMREMEVSMARERALIARQETELRRLNAEIQHELELMQRGDANLREQMAKFQRRAQEVLTKPPGSNGRR